MPSRWPALRWTQARALRRSSAPFDLSCGIIGGAAIALAAFVDWGCGDRTGAVLVLVMAGALIAVMMSGLQSGSGELPD